MTILRDYPPAVEPSAADIAHSDLQRCVTGWIKLKSMLVKTNSLPNAVTALDNARANYDAGTIDVEELEYEIVKVGAQWAALCKTKMDANDWDFFTAFE